MSGSPAYLRETTEYFTGNGWETSQKQVREGSFLVLCTKTGIEGEKRMLVMVLTATEGSVTKDHLKYLLKTARQQDADTPVITTEFGINTQIEKIAKKHGIRTISSSYITNDGSGTGFGAQSEGSQASTSWIGSESSFESKEDDTGGLLTRRRLLVGSGVGVVGLLLLGGDGSESDSPNSGSGDSSEYDVTAVKANAEEIPYGELFRSIEQYTGERVFYAASKITQVIEQSREKYQFRLNVTQNGQIWEDDILGRWKGERFLEEDLVEFWGIVNGAYQYETVMGNQRTIPDFDIVDIRLIEGPSVSAGNVEIVDDRLNISEGEFSDEITVTRTLQNNSRLNIGYVEATASLLDAVGNELTSNYVNTTGVKAGGSWRFEIAFYGEAEAKDVDSHEVDVRNLQ